MNYFVLLLTVLNYLLKYLSSYKIAKLPYSMQFDAAKLRKLRPSFKENGGSVTAGNASSIRFIIVFSSYIYIYTYIHLC